MTSKSGSQRFQAIDAAPAGLGRRRGGKALAAVWLQEEGTAVPPTTASGPKGLAAGGLGLIPGQKQWIVGSPVLIHIASGDDNSINPRLVLLHLTMDAGRVLPLSLASQGLLTDYPGGSLPQLQTGLLLKSCPRFAVEMCKVSSLPCLRMGEQSSRQNAPLKSIANAADAMFSSLPARHGTHAWDPKPCKVFKYCSEIEEFFFY